MGSSSSYSGMEPLEAMGHELVGVSASSWREEDYDCPICQDVLKTPIRTKNCRHVFCRGCFRSAVRAQGPHCPMCRGPVAKTENIAEDIQQHMRERKGSCRACGTKKYLGRMRAHYKTCRKYIEEYDVPGDAAPPVSAGPTRDAPHVPMGIIHMTGNAFAPPQMDGNVGHLVTVMPLRAGHGAYRCPYCHLQDLSDMALVRHCVSCHAGENTPAVCPICVSTSWGNSRYFSRNLIGHLVSRHNFSYDPFMNVREDEDVQLWLAVQLSMQHQFAATIRP